MDNLKRDNWTNEEVIAFLKDLELHDNKNPSSLDEQAFLEAYNTAINSAVLLFEDFQRDTYDYSAKAYNTGAEEVVIIGPILPR